MKKKSNSILVTRSFVIKPFQLQVLHLVVNVIEQLRAQKSMLISASDKSYLSHSTG